MVCLATCKFKVVSSETSNSSITGATVPWVIAFGFTRARRGKAKKALGYCAPNSVLLIAHVTTRYVDLPVVAFPWHLQLREAVDFTVVVCFTVCCILYAIIFNYQEKQQHRYMSMLMQICSISYIVKLL